MATISVLQQKPRQGTVESGTFAVPSTTAGLFRFGFTLPLDELQNTANIVIFNAYQSSDAGATWRHNVGFEWHGGDYVDRAGNILNGPSVVINAAEVAGAMVKVIVTLNRRMTIGAEIEAL